MELRPGPSVSPYAVVSSKLIVLEMPEITGNTSENITQKYRGAIRIRVTDTYRLLERGGFEKFLRQLREVYESIIKDSVLNISAWAFNQFIRWRCRKLRERASPSASITLSPATSRSST